ncbi:MAG: FG-GAP repeat protein [Myxococcales bacterium]|nr:FG-GAP repeat protein [Myxococcales bacterium]
MKARSWAVFAALALALIIVPGCGDSTPAADADMKKDTEAGPPPDGGDMAGPCTLTVTTINGRDVGQVTEISATDDQDTAAPGIQIDVEVSGANLKDDEDVELSVSNLSPNPSVKAKGGKATFSKITVSNDLTNVLITASTPSGACSSDSETFSVKPGPECFFADPGSGAALSQNDDSSTDAGFQYTVVVKTKRAESGSVALEVVGGAAVGSQNVDNNGDASFVDTTLQPGTVTLKATVKVGNVEAMCTSTFTVSTSIPQCNLTFTTAGGPVIFGGKNGLGAAHDVSSATAGLQTGVEVTTGQLVNSVEFYLDGTKVRTETPTAGKVTIADFDFGNPSPAKLQRDLKVLCIEKGSGNTGQYGLLLQVDIEAPGTIQPPACAISDGRAGDIECCWTTVADLPAGTAVGIKEYEVRYSTAGPITNANWANATVGMTVSAKPEGQTQCATVPGLGLANNYYFGVRLSDWVGNLSPTATPPNAVALDVSIAPRANAASVAVGDFNCDGHDDIAVGRPSANSNVGEVRIYLGNPNGVLANPEKRIGGSIAGGHFGAKLAALKNFDGGTTPACADLAVLADYGGTNQARVYLYLGNTGFNDRTDVGQGDGAEAYWALGGSAGAGERLVNIAHGGDFDNDGRSELVVTWHDTGSADSAEMLVIYGDQSIPMMVPFSTQTPVARVLPDDVGVRVQGGKASEGFGMSACGAGTLDNDAFGDVVVGAGGYMDSGSTRGRVWVVRGGARAGTLPEALMLSNARVDTIAAGTSNGGFGGAVGVVGDMNGDGIPEFVASDTTTASDTGTVYIFNYGSGATAPTNVAGAAATVDNNVTGAAGDKLGIALACPLDLQSSNLDKDPSSNGGYQDLVVAAADQGTTGAGVVYQFNGKSGALTNLMTAAAFYRYLPRANPVTAYGVALYVSKDVDKDGYADVIVLDPTHSSTGQFFLFH